MLSAKQPVSRKGEKQSFDDNSVGRYKLSSIVLDNGRITTLSFLSNNPVLFYTSSSVFYL